MVKFANLGELWKHNAAEFAGFPLLHCVDEGKTFTYQQMYKSVCSTANLLLELGVGKGDKVAILTSNIEEFFYVFYVCTIIGAVAAPLNYTLTADEIKYLLDWSESKLIFCEKQFLGLVPAYNAKIIGIRCGKQDSVPRFDELVARQGEQLAREASILPGDFAYLSFTSGSTGRPKGIVQSHSVILEQWRLKAPLFKMGPGDSWLCNQQLYYQDSLTYFGLPFYSGAACVMPKKFSKTRFWELVEKYKVKYTVLFPTMAKILLSEPEDVSKRNLSNVHCFFAGGSEVAPEMIRRFEAQFGILLIQGLGINETSTVFINPINAKKRKVDSLGKKLPYLEVKVLNERGEQVAANMPGELLVKGPTVITEYYKDPELTSATIQDGWLRTGDAVYYDKDGFYYFAGRIKNIIKRGGEGISPVEIDNAIMKHPAVHDSATIGVPDEIMGEEIKSYIVLKKGKKASEAEIIEHCRKHLGKTKIPKYVQFLKEMPKTHSDKPDLKMLKEMHTKGSC